MRMNGEREKEIAKLLLQIAINRLPSRMNPISMKNDGGKRKKETREKEIERMGEKCANA